MEKKAETNSIPSFSVTRGKVFTILAAILMTMLATIEGWLN